MGATDLRPHVLTAVLAGLAASIATWAVLPRPRRVEPSPSRALAPGDEHERPAVTVTTGGEAARGVPPRPVPDPELERVRVLEERVDELEARVGQLGTRRTVDAGDLSEEELLPLVRRALEEDRTRRAGERTYAAEPQPPDRRAGIERDLRLRMAWEEHGFGLTGTELERVIDLLTDLEERREALQASLEAGSLSPEAFVDEMKALEASLREDATRVLGAERARELLGL